MILEGTIAKAAPKPPGTAKTAGEPATPVTVTLRQVAAELGEKHRPAFMPAIPHLPLGEPVPAMTTTASIPFPETPEHRTAITRGIQEATGLDDVLLERLVRAFYERARHDPEIGPKFDGVQDWERHIARITAFWSSVALMTGRYHGQPLAAHVPLDLQGPHFARWLTLFEETARETCPEAAVVHLMEKAHRIAASLKTGLAVSRGELPLRRRAHP